MVQDKYKRGTALSVNLPMEMAQAVYQAVRDGRFDSAGGVIREALRQLLRLDDEGNPLPPTDAFDPKPSRDDE